VIPHRQKRRLPHHAGRIRKAKRIQPNEFVRKKLDYQEFFNKLLIFTNDVNECRTNKSFQIKETFR
jgi:hypothetical protein